MIWFSGTASGPIARRVLPHRLGLCAHGAPSPSASASRTSAQSRSGAKSARGGSRARRTPKHRPRLVGRPSCDQRQRALQMPVAQRGGVLGRMRDLVQQSRALRPGALPASPRRRGLAARRHRRGSRARPRAAASRPSSDLAGEAQEGAQIGGRRGMARRAERAWPSRSWRPQSRPACSARGPD